MSDTEQYGKLIGKIHSESVLKGYIHTEDTLHGVIHIPKIVEIPVVDIPAYDGGYEVTPRAFEDVVLPTAGLYMNKDVRVREMPHYEVSNDAEGTTYIIG